MALSAAERKKRQLDRQRAEERRLEDSTYPYLRTPFFERLDDHPHVSDLQLSFELMGLEMPTFEDDRGPEAFAFEEAMGPDADHEEIFQGSRGSIGRAENMVDNLLFAAVELAQIVNRYKKDELQARLEEIENSDLADAEARKTAMTEVAHISAVLSDLDKNVRVTLPKWRVKGI